MSSVVINNLSLNFGSVEVLKSLNLDVAEGEFLVLLGPSGCGKSTLLNCIAGLLDVTAGQVIINDKNVTWEEPKDRGIGMVFQSYALYPQMTVEKNLSFGLRVAGLPKAEIRKRVDRAAEILQIPGMNFQQGSLSSDQGQWFFTNSDLNIPLGEYAFSTTPAEGAVVEFGIRPEHIAIGDAVPSQPVQTALEIELVEPMGADTVAWSSLGGAPFTLRADSDASISTGQTLAIGFNPAKASIFSTETGLRI